MLRKHKVNNEVEKTANNKPDNISEPDSIVSPDQEKKAEDEVVESPENNNTDIETTQDTEARYQELHEKYLRLAAEYDNYRKRTLKEKAELLKYGGESVLLSILPVIDDWERAMKNIEETQDIEAIKQGIQLICNKFKVFLTQNGIKEIESFEKDFNLDIHEAVTKIPSEEFKGKIVEVLQKGYLLYDKVLRFSKVVIGE